MTPYPVLTGNDAPKSYRRNLLWRRFLVNQLRDKQRRQLIERSCSNSVTFYINSFVWIYHPMTYPNIIPFVMFRYQEKLARKIVSNILESMKPDSVGKLYDVGVDKSRGVGISWLSLTVIDWFWRFFDKMQFLCISEKETKVDKAGDYSAMLPKLDIIEQCMPKFLAVRGFNHTAKHGRVHMRVSNPKNGSVVTGETANKDAGRQGRFTGVLRDEEAAAPFGPEISAALNLTTKCVLHVSTPAGVGNTFHLAKMSGKIDWVTIHWSEHPEFSQGLYSVADGVVDVIDKEWHRKYELRTGRPYAFRIAPTYSDPGTKWEYLRSPWFDAQCDRATSDREISQEVQISYLGSGDPFFSIDKLTGVRRMNAMPPMWEGLITDLIPGLTLEDHDMRPNRCKCWFEPSCHQPPQNTHYSLGIDIATGTGVSDSVVSVGDDIQKRKVFEWKTNRVTPEALAPVVYRIIKWFTTPEGIPFVAHDAFGPGGPFGIKLMAHGGVLMYYYRQKGDRRYKLSGKPGVPLQPQVKTEVFGQFADALFSGDYITPSDDCYDQAAQYVYSDRGIPTHRAEKDATASSGKGAQHGDVVVSEVVLYLAMLQRPAPVKPKPEIPVGSFAWREQEWNKNHRAKRAEVWCDW